MCTVEQSPHLPIATPSNCEEILQKIQASYDAGMMLEAYEAGKALGPMQKWPTATAKVLAGRLLGNLGAPRLSSAVHFRALRQEPAHLAAQYFYSRSLLERKGPLAAHLHMRPLGDLSAADDRIRADWLALFAEVALILRDFDAADEFMDRAQAILPDRAWLWVVRARVLEAEDRYEESLAAAHKSLAIRKWFRPGIQATAHTLQILDRDDEALALLTEAAEKIENAPVVWQLAALQSEMERFDDARRNLDRIEALAPLMEKDWIESLYAIRSQVIHRCGDTPTAIALARNGKNLALLAVADRMASAPPSAKRVLLDVPFVRQHHMTCAPATLSAISRYWSMPADQLSVVEAICYDGTPAHSERKWAIDNGYIAREFTVTWESTVALIDRGVPFTLATVEVTSAHLQAVIGYDDTRGTMLVRDPFQYHHSEFQAELTFKRYAATGPRGMVLVPADKAHLLEGITLPDAEIYDLLFQLQAGLSRHNRASAVAALDQLNAVADNHPLTHHGRRALAGYDGDSPSSLAAVDQMLLLFPNDQGLQFAKQLFMRGQGRREDRLELLEAICGRRGCDPAFLLELAQELAADARQRPRTKDTLYKSIRRQRFGNAGAFHCLADLLWNDGERELSLELYRFAACMADKNESAAEGYFLAGRHLRKIDQTLAFLTRRFERFGRRSSLPARTLCRAYEILARLPEGMAILEKARELRPDDGDLALATANIRARHGGGEQARTLLAAASGKTNPVTWLRGAALIATYAGKLDEALKLWRQVLETQPLAMDAHDSVTRLTGQTISTAAALAHLRDACARFPYYVPLAQLHLQWLRYEGPQAAEPAARALIELRPTDAWSQRELALILLELGRGEAALEFATNAMQLEPQAPASHNILADVHNRLNRTEEAKTGWRAAISLSVDYQFAINSLLESCKTINERREALRFVKNELVRQVILGEGLLAYRAQALDTLAPDELLADLNEALTARPDLWHAWSAVTSQLATMIRLDEALQSARKACEKFPLLPRVWLDLAFVQRTIGDRAAEIEALTESLRITPGWSTASRQLAAAQSRQGDFKAARYVYKEAIARDPLDATNYGTMAELLWSMNRRRAAIVRAKQAVLLDPGLQWVWDALRHYTLATKRPEIALKLARELVSRRPGEARSWLVLARVLNGPQTIDERLAACDKARELQPQLIEAVDAKSLVLCEARRFDEALVACRKSGLGSPAPIQLRGREAWILDRSGDRQQAIVKMRIALREEPFYYWGWNTLCNWLAAGKDTAEYLRWAAEMAGRFPQDAVSQNFRADALIKSKDRAAGKAVFAKVLARYPQNEFAAINLFDEQLKDNELDNAEKTMVILRKHHDGEWTRSREFSLHARQKKASAKEFAEVFPTIASEPRAIEAAIWEMDRAKLGGAVEDFFTETMISGDKSASQKMPPIEKWGPAAAGIWINRLMPRSPRKCRQILSKLRDRKEIWIAGMLAYLNYIGEHKRRNNVRGTLWRYAADLKSDTRTWGAAGFALVSVQRYRQAAKWLSDYKSHNNVQPWMMMNLAVSLRRIGRVKNAHDAGSYALLLNRDHTTDRHIAWLAADDAATPTFGPAVAKLAQVNRANLTPGQNFLVAVVNAAVAMDASLTSDRQAAVRKARATIDAERRKHPVLKKSPELRRAFRTIVRRIAKRAGGLRAKLWALKHHF